MKKLVLFLLLVAGLTALAIYSTDIGKKWLHASSAPVKFRTAKVERGELIEGVQASGAIQPFVLVQVGTQVSGTIEKLYKDFNDVVHEGETIAVLDSRRLVAQVAQDQANLGRARADGDRVQAQLDQAEKDLARQRVLARRRLVSDADLDAAIANAGSLRAQLAVSAAVVSQSLAQLEGDMVNLRYATVVSPVDGVVVSRNVDVGQTVAASLQAPTLFVIAKDLTKIQVQASVPEADVGKIHEGQRAHFNVDAHPERVFEGRVSQVRLASSSQQNVVTYTVLIDADNPGSLLLPGMTANATFEIARAPDALKVPVTATRYHPSVDLVETAPPNPDGGEHVVMKTKGEHGDKPHNPKTGEKRRTKLYVVAPSGLLRAVNVKLGITDGSFFAVEPLEKGALDENSEVVTGIVVEVEDAGTNPFAPKFPGAVKTKQQ